MKNIIIYGADWCKDCRNIKTLLEERSYSYTMHDISDPEKGKEYSELVMEVNKGKRIIPTLCIDGEYYANPRPAELNNILDKIKDDQDPVTRCSNGKELFNGDTVLLTRDLDVKGSSLSLKKGTAIEKISLTNDPAYIDCKIGKTQMALKTIYLKKKG